MAKQKRKFEGTIIHWTKTQIELINFLRSEGINDTRFTNRQNAVMLEFVMHEKLNNKAIPIRMIIPLPTDDEKEVNRIYRVFFWYLTNKFEAVKSGLVEEITREFMAHIAYRTKDGKDTTLYEALKEEGHAILGDSNFPLLGGGR